MKYLLVLVLLVTSSFAQVKTVNDALTIEGRLIDISCGAIGGIPWKVVHNEKCFHEHGASFYILERGTNKMIKITDVKMIAEANKNRLLLAKGEVYAKITQHDILITSLENERKIK